MDLHNYNPGMVYKLNAGESMAGMLGMVLQKAETKPDATKMMARYIISTGSIDRSREIVDPNGLLLDDHRKNPIVLCNHDRNAPVGLCRTPEGQYTVTKGADGVWYGDFYFDQHSLIGQQTFDAVYRGMLNGASIGFMPVPNMTMETKANDGYPVKYYKQTKLVEVSVVPIPQNADCIKEMVYKGLGGKPLDAQLLSILKPYAGEKSVSVVGGWETKGMEENKCHYVKFNLTGNAVKAVKAACDVVDKDDLGEGGCCDVPHVSVMYGINKDVDAEQVKSLLNTFGPFSVKFGDVDYFANDDCDLLHFKMEKPNDPPVLNNGVFANAVVDALAGGKSLWSLNESLSALPHEDAYPQYKPHATIAYLKKGKGEYYKSMLKGDPGVGFVSVSEVVLVTAKGDEIVIPLVGLKSADRIQSKTNRKVGWRVKAMQGYTDDPMEGQTNQVADDPMMQSDEQAEPTMKVGASFAHTLYQQLAQMIDMIDTGLEHQEQPDIITLGKRLKSILGHAADKMHLHYDKYRTKHKDMPELPKMEMGEDDGFGDDLFKDEELEDEKTTTDEDATADDTEEVDDDSLPDEPTESDESDESGDDVDDSEEDSEIEESDEGDDEEDEDDDKWDKKALATWYRKADAVVKGWWDWKTKKITDANIGPVREAKEFCAKIAANEKAGKKVRELALLHTKALSAALGESVEGTEELTMVVKANPQPTTTDDGMDEATMRLLLEKMDSLSKIVVDQGTILTSITGR